MDAGQDKNTRERFISVLGFDYNTNRSIIDLLSRKKQRRYYLGWDCRSRRLIELSLLIKAATTWIKATKDGKVSVCV